MKLFFLVFQTNRVSYADLIVDQSSGIVLRPLSLLSSDVGLRTLVNLATALSLQYEKCWIILFAQADNRCGQLLLRPCEFSKDHDVDQASVDSYMELHGLQIRWVDRQTCTNYFQLSIWRLCTHQPGPAACIIGALLSQTRSLRC